MGYECPTTSCGPCQTPATVGACCHGACGREEIGCWLRWRGSQVGTQVLGRADPDLGRSLQALSTRDDTLFSHQFMEKELVGIGAVGKPLSSQAFGREPPGTAWACLLSQAEPVRLPAECHTLPLTGGRFLISSGCLRVCLSRAHNRPKQGGHRCPTWWAGALLLRSLTALTGSKTVRELCS